MNLHILEVTIARKVLLATTHLPAFAVIMKTAKGLLSTYTCNIAAILFITVVVLPTLLPISGKASPKLVI